MVWLAFVLMTVAPIAAGALIGRHLGPARLLRGLGLYVVGALAFACGCAIGFAARWFWPLGLVTPVAIGGAAGVGAAWFSARIRPLRAGRGGSPRTGAACGATFGVAVAVLVWMTVPIVDAGCGPRAASRSRPADVATSLGELATIAHRGLLRHVPLLGETSEEMAAVCALLRASPEQHRRLAERLGITHLADVPSVRAALEDADLVDDLVAARDGDLLALFRLQRHPRVLAVAESDEVAVLFSELRPSRMAAVLETMR